MWVIIVRPQKGWITEGHTTQHGYCNVRSKMPSTALVWSISFPSDKVWTEWSDSWMHVAVFALRSCRADATIFWWPHGKILCHLISLYVSRRGFGCGLEAFVRRSLGNKSFGRSVWRFGWRGWRLVICCASINAGCYVKTRVWRNGQFFLFNSLYSKMGDFFDSSNSTSLLPYPSKS